MDAEAPNAEMIAYWNGPIGARWATEQEMLDRAFAAFGSELIEAAAFREGMRVLDIGCGCGTTTLAASDAVGAAGVVLGVDVSAPLLARARERAQGRQNLAFVEADASAHPFDRRPEAQYDVAISRFGVMFFRDPTAAFRNIRTGLRPAGRLAFVSWATLQENPWASRPMDVVRKHLPEGQPAAPPPGPDEPGPFSFADPGRVQRILTGAGFSEVSGRPFTARVVASRTGLDEAIDFAMANGPAGRALREAPAQTKVRVREELRATLPEWMSEGPDAHRHPFSLPGAVNVWTAASPADAP
jgi:SAM-dependent methyltransferase